MCYSLICYNCSIMSCVMELCFGKAKYLLPLFFKFFLLKAFFSKGNGTLIMRADGRR